MGTFAESSRRNCKSKPQASHSSTLVSGPMPFAAVELIGMAHLYMEALPTESATGLAGCSANGCTRIRGPIPLQVRRDRFIWEARVRASPSTRPRGPVERIPIIKARCLPPVLFLLATLSRSFYPTPYHSFRRVNMLSRVLLQAQAVAGIF